MYIPGEKGLNRKCLCNNFDRVNRKSYLKESFLLGVEVKQCWVIRILNFNFQLSAIAQTPLSSFCGH